MSKIKNLDLSSFNSENVIDMTYMFCGCENLIDLDLSSFIINQDNNYKNIFNECNNLKDTYSSYLNKNEIEILVKIGKKDINKEIYFLDNYEFEDNQGKQHFHDNLKELKDINTELYINNKKYEYSKCFIPEKEGEYKINLKFNINLSNCSYMFAGCEKIKKIDFISFHSKYVTNMKYMFYKCNNLKIINNLFSFDTSNTINMSYMFSECKNLNNLELSSFNTEKVKSLNNMFSECNNLYSLDL